MNAKTPGSRSETTFETADGADDEILVARTARGDRAAYGVLVCRHVDRYLALAERLLGDRAEAEDVLQDAFSRLWTRADSFDPAAARFTTWFYRVVANACYDRMRRRKRFRPLSDGWDGVDDTESADSGIERAQRAAEVRRALDRLPERQKMAVVLCYFEGVSNLEAAQVMEVSVKALESLLVRARRALRECLETEED